MREVLPAWLTARGLVAAGYVLAFVIAQRWFDGGTTPQLHEGLATWDGTYYRDIARVGYAGLPQDALRFFPVYPLVGRAGALVAFGHTTVVLVLIANVAAFGFAVVLRRIALFETADAALARRAVWLSAIFPSAFVLVFAYAEALFLVVAAGAFLAARTRHWWVAAACAAVAAGTRPLGVLLVVPLVIEAVRQPRPTPARVGDLVGRGVASVAPMAGLALYLGWVRSVYGTATLPFTVQTELRGEANPLVRIGRGLGDLFGPERFGDGLHIPFAVAFVVLLVVCFRRWPAVYGVFAALVLVVALSADNLNSLERYGLNAFPLLLALASVMERPRVERIVLVVCGGGLASLAALAWLSVYVP